MDARAAVCVCLLLLVPLVEDDRTADSLAHEYRRRLAAMTSPALERRKADRRLLQKRGYAGVLAEVIRNDGPGALLAFARMRLQLEFSLPNDPLVAYYPVIAPDARRDSLPGFTTFGSQFYAVPLIEDRGFPRDPWESP